MFLFGFCFSIPFITIVFCYSQLLLMLKSVRDISELISLIWVHSIIREEHNISHTCAPLYWTVTTNVELNIKNSIFCYFILHHILEANT